MGDAEDGIKGLQAGGKAVLSHFYKDHTGNPDKMHADAICVFGETFRYTLRRITA